MKEHWMLPVAKKEERLTAEEVLALPVGSKISINGENSKGEKQETDCTVAGHFSKKFLTYRDATGKIKRCAIKDYEGKYYTKE